LIPWIYRLQKSNHVGGDCRCRSRKGSLSSRRGKSVRSIMTNESVSAVEDCPAIAAGACRLGPARGSGRGPGELPDRPGTVGTQRNQSIQASLSTAVSQVSDYFSSAEVDLRMFVQRSDTVTAMK